MKQKGFSLAEVIVALSLILGICFFTSVYQKNLRWPLQKRALHAQSLNTAVNFLELTRALVFEDLKNYHGQKLAGQAGEISVTALNADLYQICINSKNFNLTTLRSKYE